MSAAVIPSMADLWNGATLPDLLCDPCASGRHPIGGCDARIPALATDGEATAVVCGCPRCHRAFNRAFWARVRREGAA